MNTAPIGQGQDTHSSELGPDGRAPTEDRVLAVDPFDPPKAHLLGMLLSLPVFILLGQAVDFFPDALFICVASWIVISRKRGHVADLFGLKKVEIGALALPIALALVFKSSELLALEGIDMVTGGALSAWSDLFPSPAEEGFLLFQIFCVSVIVPISEEMFFRGFFQSALKPLGYGWSVMLPSMIFALWHHPMAMPGAFIVGLSAGLLTARHNSVVPAIILHAAANLYLTLLGSMQERYGDLAGFAFYVGICVAGILLVFRIRPELSLLWVEAKLAWHDFRSKPAFTANARLLFRHWSYLLIILEICLTLAAIAWATAQGQPL